MAEISGPCQLSSLAPPFQPTSLGSMGGLNHQRLPGRAPRGLVFNSDAVPKAQPSLFLDPSCFLKGRKGLRDDLDLKEMGLYSRVGLKVPIVDGLNQLFCDLNDLLFPHCRGEKSTNLPM